MKRKKRLIKLIFIVFISIIIFIILYSDIKYIVKNNNSIGKLSIIIYIEIVLAIVFAILRNII